MTLISAFEKAIQLSEPLKEEYRQEAYNIFAEDSFDEFLKYCWEHDALLLFSYNVFRYDVYVYDSEEDNYYEEDYDKKVKILDKIFDGKIEEYAKNYEGEDNA